MRAADLPREWEQLLEATRADDYDEAQRICFKYGFGDEPVVRKLRKYTYYWTSPNGNQGITVSNSEMGRVMGITAPSVYKKFEADKSDSVIWTQGDSKDWEITRVLKEDD